MPEARLLFENNTRLCQRCRRPLPPSSEEELCPACIRQALFEDVKDYIRKYDVNEQMVAEHFHIPISMVKGWIREGRIEYKDEHLNNRIIDNFCQICGTQITFGSMCTNCARIAKMSGSSVGRDYVPHDNRMRFLDDK